MQLTETAQIGPWLREARRRKGLSLDEVCNALGMSKSQLSNLETGTKIPLLHVLLRLLAFYEGRLELHQEGKKETAGRLAPRQRTQQSRPSVRGMVIRPTPAQALVLRGLAEGGRLEEIEEKDSSGTRKRWWLIIGEAETPVRPHIPLVLQQNKWTQGGKITKLGRQVIAPPNE